MRSILVRFTSSKYVDSYIAGDLYLSSLSHFWTLSDGKDGIAKQLDFSEGVSAQVPRDILDEIVDREAFSQYAIHDARFRSNKLFQRRMKVFG
jgi:hypothetical protein